MRRGRKDERGAVLVEFALIVPVLLALVFGIISYGYMLSYRQGLSQAASAPPVPKPVICPSSAPSTPRSSASTYTAEVAVTTRMIRLILGFQETWMKP